MATLPVTLTAGTGKPPRGCSGFCLPVSLSFRLGAPGCACHSWPTVCSPRWKGQEGKALLASNRLMGHTEQRDVWTGALDCLSGALWLPGA